MSWISRSASRSSGSVMPFRLNALEDRPQVISQVLADAVVAHQEPQPPLRIEDVALHAVVDRVALTALRLLEVDLELFRDLLGRGEISAQGEEARIERGDVLSEGLGRIALGIDAHHQHL